MAKEALVETMISESARLLEELDKQGDTVSNMLWFYYSDAEDWRLLVAGSAFDKLLPKDEAQAYRRIAIAIGKANLDSLTIASVKAIRTDDSIIVATKFLVRTDSTGSAQVRFKDSWFNGIFVEEMVVLRAA